MRDEKEIIGNIESYVSLIKNLYEEQSYFDILSQEDLKKFDFYIKKTQNFLDELSLGIAYWSINMDELGEPENYDYLWFRRN